MGNTVGWNTQEFSFNNEIKKETLDFCGFAAEMGFHSILATPKNDLTTPDGGSNPPVGNPCFKSVVY